MNDSFILYTSYYAIIEGLTDEQLGQLTRALFIYARDGEVTKLEPVVRMAFSFIKDNIDRNQDKYQAKCEKNRQIALEREKRKREAREKSESTNVHERSRTCEKSTNVHERSPYDNDNEYDNDNDVSNETINKEEINSSKSISGKPKVDVPEKAVRSSVSKIDFAAIKDYWNAKHDETKSAMRRLTLMSDQRKSNVRARLREYGGDVAKVYQAIDIAMASDFMNGKNDKGWVASFDWIMHPSNFPKVLEGNYTNEQPTASQRGAEPAETARPSLGERYRQVQQQQPAAAESQDNKYRSVIGMMLDAIRKNPRDRAARQTLERYYEQGIIQRLGISWEPEK